MNNFPEELRSYQQLINASLKDYLPSDEVSHKEVIDAMGYSLLDGGKRVRGVLLLAFYKMFSGKEEASCALPFAAGIEMIHAYSLIHDDLPCMDDDNMRRGKPSNHIRFGESTALLAGDGLLTLAFGVYSNPLYGGNFTPKQILRTIQILSGSAGVDGMIGGQVLDLQNEKKSATIEEVVEAEKKKTGALFKASVLIGSVLGGATEDQLELAGQYAEHIGLTFQIVDDILDKTAKEEKLGKPIGSDSQRGKTTFTTVYGLEKAQEIAAQHTAEGLYFLEKLEKQCDFIKKFTSHLVSRDY